MTSILNPTEYHTPTAATGPQPCRWEGWVDLGSAGGVVWMVVVALEDEG